MEHSPFLLFQAALLLGQLTGSAIGGLSSDCPVPTTLPLDNQSQSVPGTPLPLLDKTGNFGWQPGMCTLASSASSDAVRNAHRGRITFGALHLFGNGALTVLALPGRLAAWSTDWFGYRWPFIGLPGSNNATT
ncbi:hypothetical protein MTO96_024176 [Rhipicephalus appendiculatus]